MHTYIHTYIYTYVYIIHVYVYIYICVLYLPAPPGAHHFGFLHPGTPLRGGGHDQLSEGDLSKNNWDFHGFQWIFMDFYGFQWIL